MVKNIAQVFNEISIARIVFLPITVKLVKQRFDYVLNSVLLCRKFLFFSFRLVQCFIYYFNSTAVHLRRRPSIYCRGHRFFFLC